MNELYTVHAALYAKIADDRDFNAELAAMGALALRQGDSFVELFAGPAYHSANLCRLNTGVQIIAVDSSGDMNVVARQSGYEGAYTVADALEGLTKVDQANLICIPRFSIGLVGDDYLRRLMAEVSTTLTPTGLFFVEVHGDEFVDAAIDPIAWRKLSIHERVVQAGDETIRCVWPHDIRLLSAADTQVEMDVVISHTVDAVEHRHALRSHEYLRTCASVVALAAAAQLLEVPERHFATKTGRYLAFRRTASAAEIHQERSARLRRGAFGALFALDGAENQSAHLHRSGFNLQAHDVPFSLHVYNLL